MFTLRGPHLIDLIDWLNKWTAWIYNDPLQAAGRMFWTAGHTSNQWSNVGYSLAWASLVWVGLEWVPVLMMLERGRQSQYITYNRLRSVQHVRSTLISDVKEGNTSYARKNGGNQYPVYGMDLLKELHDLTAGWSKVLSLKHDHITDFTSSVHWQCIIG